MWEGRRPDGCTHGVDGRGRHQEQGVQAGAAPGQVPGHLRGLEGAEKLPSGLSTQNSARPGRPHVAQLVALLCCRARRRCAGRRGARPRCDRRPRLRPACAPPPRRGSVHRTAPSAATSNTLMCARGASLTYSRVWSGEKHRPLGWSNSPGSTSSSAPPSPPLAGSVEAAVAHRAAPLLSDPVVPAAEVGVGEIDGPIGGACDDVVGAVEVRAGVMERDDIGTSVTPVPNDHARDLIAAMSSPSRSTTRPLALSTATSRPPCRAPRSRPSVCRPGCR